MNQNELQYRLEPLMTRKMPLHAILEALSDIPSERVTATYDALTLEAFDIDLVYEAAA